MDTISLVGQVSGELTAVECVGRGADRALAFWKCRCSCGQEVIVSRSNFVGGKVRSCGCLRIKANQARRKAALTHFTEEPEYAVLNAMKDRCGNPKNGAFKYYGGRGIKVCARWQNGEDSKSGYECFIEDVGRRPTDGKYLIERVNNDGNYEPGNCIWVKREAQVRNRRSNRWVMYQGERLCMADAARKAGLRKALVHDRLNRGWSDERALSQTPDTYNKERARLVMYQGREMPLVEACSLAGLPYQTVHLRLRYGWTHERALTQPLRKV